MNAVYVALNRICLNAINFVVLLILALAMSAGSIAFGQKTVVHGAQLRAPQTLPLALPDQTVSLFHLQQPIPLAITSADIDGDGVADLLIGYGLLNGGVIAIQKGNLDAIAPQSHESWLAVGQGRYSSPFHAEASTIQVSVRPSLLVVADINGDGHKDLVIADRTGQTISIYLGNGKGDFTPQSTYRVSGNISALTTLRLAGNASADVILAGVNNADSSKIIMYSYAHTSDMLQVKAEYAVSGPVSSFAIANLDDDLVQDAAFVAGGQLYIMHGKNALKGEAYFETLPIANVNAMVTGEFLFDRHAQLQIAVLTTDGTVHIFAHSGFDPHAYTREETAAIRKNAILHKNMPVTGSTGTQPWTEIETIHGVVSGGTGSDAFVMLRARGTAQGSDDILVVDDAQQAMESIHHTATGLGTGQPQPTVIRSSMSTSGVVGVLSQRVSPQNSSGLIALSRNSIHPEILTPIQSNTLFVNTQADTLDANDGPRCTLGSAEACSLRDAITYANQDAAVNIAGGTSDTIMVPSGTYQLSYQSGITDGNGNAVTHLEILGPVTIIGDTSGSGVVIDANHTDTVFTINPGIYGSYNPSGNSFAFDTTFENLTIQNGSNNNNPMLSALPNNVGGAINWDAFGTGNLTLNNCTITSNAILWGAGGGIWAINSVGGGSGILTIAGGSISGNSTPEEGGGIYIGYPAVAVTATNAQISANIAQISVNSSDPGSLGEGGGLYITTRNGGLATPQSTFTNVTLDSNLSTIDGAGIYTNSGIMVSASTISNNATGRWGGGVFSNVDSPETSTSIAGSNIFFNSATGAGGAISVGADAATNGNLLTVANSRIFSNTSTGGASGLAVGAPSTTGAGGVMATENWWGCNAGPTTVSDGCDQAILYDAGSGSMTTDPRIVLTLNVTPNPVNENSALQLIGVVNTDSGGGSVSGGVGPLSGMNILFSAIVGSFNATPVSAINSSGNAFASVIPDQVGSGTASATLDNQTVNAGFTVQVVAGPATHFQISAPSSITSSVAGALTVTALDASNNIATGYAGTVHLSSTDPAFVNLAGDHTLTNGVGTFGFQLMTAGNQTITATDTVNLSITGTSNTVSVFPGPTVAFIVSAPTNAVPGVAITFTITAVDAFGNVATGYSGTIHITSSDGSSTLPADTTLTNGMGSYSATLSTNGMQTITATDTVTSAITGTSGPILVATPNLVVTTVLDDAGIAGNCTLQTTPGTGTDASCSLRDALLQAAALGAAKITFDSTHFAAPQTIQLLSSSGVMNIPSNTAVSGPFTGIGVAQINLVTLSGNNATPIFNTSVPTHDASITNLILTEGNNAGSGGAIDNSGILNVYNSTFLNNFSSGFGGAVHNNGNMTFTSCTFSGNMTASGEVGAAIEMDSGVIAITSSTIFGNASGLHGGAIYLNGGTLTISNTTISGNTANTAMAGIGGGIFNNTGTLTVTNSIFAGDTGGECSGSGCPVNGTNGNVVDVAANLSALGSYGGATQTLIPLPGSPAVCAISPSSATETDQRGYARATTYGANTCQDSGAVQTNYTIAFSGNPPASVGVAADFTAGVTISENGNALTAGSSDVSLTLNGAGTLTNNGSGPVSIGTVSGVATFSALQVSANGNGDSLTASLQITGASTIPQVILATDSSTFDVSIAVTTTIATNATAVYSASVQSIMLAANISSGSGPVNAGTVTFTVLQGSTPIGSPVTSAMVVNGAASVSYALPAGTAVGIYTIQATYNASGIFSTSNDNGHTLTISQATATITLSNLNQTYTGSPLPATVATAPAGLTVEVAYDGSFTAPTAAGSYAVSATINDPNYIGSATGTLVIDKASELLSWTPAISIPYGTTLSSLLNASATFQANPVIGALNYTATPSGGSAMPITGSSVLAVGNYGLTVLFTPADTTNFNAVTLTVPLIVNKATLSIFANDATRVYGVANPVFSGSVTGAVNGDAFTESFSTSATLGSNTGTYAIVPSVSGSALSNYVQTATNGTLTITQAQSSSTLSLSSPSINVGANLTISVQVTSATTGTPTGVVNILDGAIVIATVPLSGSMASFSTTTLASGVTHLLSVAYGGDANFQASNSSLVPLIVNLNNLAITANNATKVYGTANPIFSGSVTGAINGDTFIESFSTTATLNSNVGTYAIVPSIVGANLGSYSVTTTNGALAITQATSLTKLNLSSSSVNPGQSLTLNAQVSSSTTGIPTGTVTFMDGPNILATASLSGGVASYTTDSLVAGVTHTLSVVYSGDDNFYPSSSGVGSAVPVSPLDFTMVIAGPNNQIVAPGSSISYQVTVTPIYGAFAGQVNFAVDGLPQGAAVTFSPSSLSANSGPQTVTVTIQTAALTAEKNAPSFAIRHFLPYSLALILLPLFGLRCKRFIRLSCVILIALGGLTATTLLSGCGSSGLFSRTPTSYTVTILATAGNLEHSATVTINVE